VYRRTPSPELVSAVAHHEAGHASGVVTALRNAAWLPNPMPQWLVRYVEITEDTRANGAAVAVSPDIYSVRWSIDCIAEPFRDLMARQIVVHLAGGIAEAICRGERPGFAKLNCNADADLAAAVLADLRKLTGRRLRAYTNNSE
jgi:hypothetical protein